MSWRDRATPVEERASDWKSRAVKEKPSLLDIAKEQWNRAHGMSPAGLAVRGLGFAQRKAGEYGERTAETMAGRGQDPRLAAGVGTAIAMGPDLLQMAATPAPIPQIPRAALGAARRALGYMASQLKSPFSRGRAMEASKTALEKGVIPWSGNPDVMLSRAMDLANKSGSKFGAIIKKMGFDDLALDFESNLNRLEQSMTKGATGTTGPLRSMVGKVKQDIYDLYTKGLDASEYVAIKKRVTDSINYFADLSSQVGPKAVAAELSSSLKKAVKTLLPDSYDDYVKYRKLYGDAMSMIGALNPEIARQMGRELLALPAVVAGTSAMGEGMVKGAARGGFILGTIEYLRRRGAPLAARTIQSLSRGTRFLPHTAPLINRAFPQERSQ